MMHREYFENGKLKRYRVVIFYVRAYYLKKNKQNFDCFILRFNDLEL